MSKLSKALQRAKQTQPVLANLNALKRRKLLLTLAQELQISEAKILQANLQDLQSFSGSAELRDRLLLNKKRFRVLASSVAEIARLPEVLGKILETRRPKNGLVIQKVSVPLGVIGVIYESRPNVTIDIAALALKAGNAVVLKGGRESYHSNKMLVGLIHNALKKNGLPRDLVFLIEPRVDWRRDLFTAQKYLDVLIPRGGARLINYVRDHARVPVIETGAGVCHTFVDETFNLQKTIEIIVNAKTQRPSVCNSLDTLVVHRKAETQLLPVLSARLAKYQVEIFADRAAFAILKKYYPSSLLHRAKPTDFGKEFLSLKMAVKTVESFAAGLHFVSAKTSGHSEAVISLNRAHIRTFLEEIDAAVVYDNVSTRFTDGGEFGMGAEVGISTQKLHVRGPMGAEALTSYKWIVSGTIYVRG